MLFNVIYSCFPIMIYSLWDKEFKKDDFLVNSPYLYISGREGLLFNKKKFWSWILRGAYQAMMILCLAFYNDE